VEGEKGGVWKEEGNGEWGGAYQCLGKRGVRTLSSKGKITLNGNEYKR